MLTSPKYHVAFCYIRRVFVMETIPTKFRCHSICRSDFMWLLLVCCDFRETRCDFQLFYRSTVPLNRRNWSSFNCVKAHNTSPSVLALHLRYGSSRPRQFFYFILIYILFYFIYFLILIFFLILILNLFIYFFNFKLFIYFLYSLILILI